MTPSSGQTLTKLVVFDASSYFLHLCGIDTSSSYIQIREIILLLLIFDYFTPILQHVHSDRINGGLPLLPPPSSSIFRKYFNISQARYQSIHEEKSLTNIYFYYSSASIFVPVLYILSTILDANSIKFESIPKMSSDNIRPDFASYH